MSRLQTAFDAIDKANAADPHLDETGQPKELLYGQRMTAEQQARLFEPFNRLGLERSAVEGHGIGLALARRLVELQNGQIGVVSEPGEGATFWVTLPGA